MVKPQLLKKYNLDPIYRFMTNANRQTERQTHKVITCQVFTRCQQKIQYSINLVTTVIVLVICPYKLMHLARWVLSASSLHGGKKELLIIVRHFVGQQMSDIIV